MDTTLVTVDERQPQAAIVAFGIGPAKDAIARASDVATAVASVVEDRKLFTPIQGKKYVRVEGWTTMGALLGVFPQIEWSRAVEREGVYGYEARAVVKTLAGAVVSAGDAECWSDERNWSNRDRYALRSMAETRATGKAMRVALSWVMALAGYEATPAEEMPTEPFPTKNPARKAPRSHQDAPGSSEPTNGMDDAIREEFPASAPVAPRVKQPLVGECQECHVGITDAVQRYSIKQFGKGLCFADQKKLQDARA